MITNLKLVRPSEQMSASERKELRSKHEAILNSLWKRNRLEVDIVLQDRFLVTRSASYKRWAEGRENLKAYDESKGMFKERDIEPFDRLKPSEIDYSGIRVLDNSVKVSLDLKSMSFGECLGKLGWEFESEVPAHATKIKGKVLGDALASAARMCLGNNCQFLFESNDDGLEVSSVGS